MRRSVVGLAIVAFFAAGDAALAQSTKVGTLTCMKPGTQEPPPVLLGVEPRIPLECTFSQIPARGSAEAYRPTLLQPPLAAPDQAFVQYTWNVFAGAFTGDVAYGPGILAGGYGPAADNEPLVQGLTGQVLIGGPGNEIALVAASPLEAAVTGLELLHCVRVRC